MMPRWRGVVSLSSLRNHQHGHAVVSTGYHLPLPFVRFYESLDDPRDGAICSLFELLPSPVYIEGAIRAGNVRSIAAALTDPGSNFAIVGCIIDEFIV